MAEKENLDIPMILVVGVVSVVLTAASVIGVQALFYSYQNKETDRKVTAVPTAEADSRLAEQDAKLARYAWANREEGRVVIPIDRAMKLTANDYQISTDEDKRDDVAQMSTPNERMIARTDAKAEIGK